MGSVCCVAAGKKTIGNGSASDALHRNFRNSPSWSVQWDSRGRVVGEETSINWFPDGVRCNERSEIKLESSYASSEGSSRQHCRSNTHTWVKSLTTEGTDVLVRTPTSAVQSISRNISDDAILEQVKEATQTPAASYTSPANLTVPFPSIFSSSTSLLPSQSHLPPTSSRPKLSQNSPGDQLLRQVSDNQSPGFRSSPTSCLVSEDRTLPSWSNEFTRNSGGGSSDGWSHALSELVATSQRERWSFDSESFGFNREKMARSSNRFSASASVDLQTCGVCSKLLTERSPRKNAANEVPVVAVLTCGHVYHAECLEDTTPEINKYDPDCPVCALQEKKTLRLSADTLKAEMELKSGNKRSRKRVVDSDSAVYDGLNSSLHHGKDPKMLSSTSFGGSHGRPFLRRHFSFGSKRTASQSDNHSTRKKGFF